MVAPGQRFCPNCAAPVSAGAAQGFQQGAPSQYGAGGYGVGPGGYAGYAPAAPSRAPLIITIVVLVIVLAGGGVTVYLFKDKLFGSSSSNSNASSTNTQAQANLDLSSANSNRTLPNADTGRDSPTPSTPPPVDLGDDVNLGGDAPTAADVEAVLGALEDGDRERLMMLLSRSAQGEVDNIVRQGTPGIRQKGGIAGIRLKNVQPKANSVVMNYEVQFGDGSTNPNGRMEFVKENGLWKATLN